MSDLVYRAMTFAMEAHKDQKRKYTNEPYFLHLAEVAVLAKRLEVSVTTYNAGYYPSDGKAVAVSINDNTGGCITEDSVELPVPTLQY